MSHAEPPLNLDDRSNAPSAQPECAESPLSPADDPWSPLSQRGLLCGKSTTTDFAEDQDPPSPAAVIYLDQKRGSRNANGDCEVLDVWDAEDTDGGIGGAVVRASTPRHQEGPFEGFARRLRRLSQEWAGVEDPPKFTGIEGGIEAAPEQPPLPRLSRTPTTTSRGLGTETGDRPASRADSQAESLSVGLFDLSAPTSPVSLALLSPTVTAARSTATSTTEDPTDVRVLCPSPQAPMTAEPPPPRCCGPLPWRRGKVAPKPLHKAPATPRPKANLPRCSVLCCLRVEWLLGALVGLAVWRGVGCGPVLGLLSCALVAALLGACQCLRRAECALAFVCQWVCLVLTGLGVGFVWVVYWSCITLPLAELGALDAAAAHEHNVSRQVYQPRVARERAARGLVNVISLNMYLRSNPIAARWTRGDNDFKNERLEAFLARLDDYDVLLLLQEVWPTWDEGRKARLVNSARDRGFRFFARSACRGRPVSGMLLIMSRHVLTHAHELAYEEATGTDSLASKGALWVRAFVNGERACQVDLFNTHMQAEGRWGGDGMRWRQIGALGRHVRATLGDAATPAVVAGDFNVNGRTALDDGTPSHLYHRIVRELALNESGWELTDVVASDNMGQIRATVAPDGPHSKILMPLNESDGIGLDFAFFVRPSAPSPVSGPAPPDGHAVRPVPGSGRVDPMLVEGRPFGSISDHWAVTFTLSCSADV